MKIKKHIVAVAMAVGLAGSVGAFSPAPLIGGNAGYYLAKYAMNDHEAEVSVAGSLMGAMVGRRAVWAGARLGAAAGSFFGPVGLVVGAAVGAA